MTASHQSSQAFNPGCYFTGQITARAQSAHFPDSPIMDACWDHSFYKILKKMTEVSAHSPFPRVILLDCFALCNLSKSGPYTATHR